MGGCLVMLLAVGLGIGVGVLTESILFGIVTTAAGLFFLATVWNETGAVINMSTQDKRDEKIISELKKMNEDDQ